jgi:hypothetical protein
MFKNKINGKKLVFYPCPKNGNSSAKLFFAKHLGLDKDYVFIGDKIPRYQQKVDDFGGKKNLINFLPTKQPFEKIISDYKCCIVRDPLSRFISAYKNRINYHKDEDFKGHTVDMVLEKLENNNFENQHFLTQSYFLGSSLDYYDFYSNINNVTIFQREVNNFFDNNLAFPKIQTGGGDSELRLTSEQCDKVKKIYLEDYELLKIKT